MMLGRVVCRCVSVFCKLSSVVCREELSSLEKVFLITIFLDLLSKLYVGVLFVEVFVKMSISSLCTVVKVSST